MKKKIVIASILKPVDDVRAYWKLSQSIAKTNKYEVNIIGNSSKKDISHENISQHPHHIARNQWLKRIAIRQKILFNILKIKPSLLIVNTHELLIMALIVRLIIKCKIIYDVQENYFLNLSKINPTIPKKLYAIWVRAKERFSRNFVDEYWLAESCYQKELSFVIDCKKVIENKAILYPTPHRKIKPIRLLFSGTISKYSRVDRAFSIYERINKYYPDTSLFIIGQIHDEQLRIRLETQANLNDGITLKISKQPIPYDDILEAITDSTLGVIAYSPNEVNQHKIPTKLYEYSRYKLPFLVENNTEWSLAGKYLGGALPVDFDDLNPQLILEKLKKSEDLFVEPYPKEATWEYESSKIINSLNSLIT